MAQSETKAPNKAAKSAKAPVSPAPAGPQTLPAGPLPAVALQRALAPPPADPRPTDILALQQSLGNRTVRETLTRRPAAPVQREGEDELPGPIVETLGREQTEHFTYQRLDADGRRPVPPAELSRRIAAAESAGHRVIRQSQAGHPERPPVVYEEIPHEAQLWPQFMLNVNGVAIPIRNATREEIDVIRAALSHVPAAHLEVFLTRRRRIVVADWTGSAAEGVSTHRLSGGTNMTRSISSSQRRQAAEVEEGPRIELTHTALQDAGAARLTILHEMGHVVYEANLIPRSVEGTYGSSVHTGASEQPAYAYMVYLTRPAHLQPADRSAFAAAFERQGLSTAGEAEAAPADMPEETPATEGE